jgi:RNA polymerase sigma-70 factor (ECF subfamily)
MDKLPLSPIEKERELELESLKPFLMHHIWQMLTQLNMLGWIEVNDVFQEVYLKIYIYPKKIENYRGFVQTVANRFIYNQLRKLKKVRTEELDKIDYFVNQSNPLNSNQSWETQGSYRSLEYLEMYAVISEVLNEQEQKIIYLRFFEGFSWEQVAQKVGSTTEAVRKKNQRILRKLKNQLS